VAFENKKALLSQGNRDKGLSNRGLLNINVGLIKFLLRFRRCCVNERSAVFSAEPNILRITVRFRTSALDKCVNRLYSKYVKNFSKGCS